MADEHAPSANDPERQRLLAALRESELLRELAGLLASSLDLDSILQTLVKRTTEVCAVGRCAVWLLDDANAVLRPVVYHLDAQKINGKRLRIADQLWYRSTLAATNPLMSRLLSEKGLLYLEDLRSEVTLRAVAEMFLVRSILLVALIREGRPVGMMSLDNPGEHCVFSEEQQQLAHAIGQQAAMAIDNAQLYRRAQAERKRAEQLIERSQAIYQVAMAVNSDEDLASILKTAAQHLIHGLEADAGTILLLDAGRLHPARPQEDAQAARSERGQADVLLTDLPFCRQAIEAGTPLFVSARRLGIAELSWFTSHGLENTLIVPLLVGAIRKNGEGRQRCVGLAFASFHDSHHRPTRGQYAFAQDIAAQCALAIEKTRLLHDAHQAAVLATERANTLNAIFQAMTEGITVFSNEGRLLLYNNSAAAFVGPTLQNGELLGDVFKHHEVYNLQGQRIDLEQFPLSRALRGEYVQGGERILTRRADGIERILEVHVAPVLDEKEQQIGAVSAFRDVTQQSRIEQHIHQALEALLHMAEALSGLTDVQDILHSVLSMALAALHCERGLVSLYNEEQQRFVPLHALENSTDENKKRRIGEQMQWLICELQQRGEFQVEDNPGHAFLLTPEQQAHLRTAARTVLTAPAEESLALVTPITHSSRLLGVILLERPLRSVESGGGLRQERWRTEFTIWDMAVIEGIAQLAGLAMEQARWQQEAIKARSSEEAMREANALKDEFLAITAHEFRTPLTLILAHSQFTRRILQRNGNKKLLERLNENLTTIEEQTRHLTNIVTTFLEAAQINRGQLTLTQEEVDLQQVIEQIVANQRTTAAQRQIIYTCEPSERPYLVKGDRERLQQVVANLVQNAIKYSPQGGPITLSLGYRQEATIEVCVADKGIGIPRDALAHLFERFYRAPNTQVSGARGIGLGLYVVAELLRMHGGSIRAESSGVPGEGSRFIFTLPALESETKDSV